MENEIVIINPIEETKQKRFICIYCGKEFFKNSVTGRKPKFCKSQHRSAYYNERHKK